MDPDSPGETRFFKSLQGSRAHVPTLLGRLEKKSLSRRVGADRLSQDTRELPRHCLTLGVPPTLPGQSGQHIPECPGTVWVSWTLSGTVGLNMPRLS